MIVVFPCCRCDEWHDDFQANVYFIDLSDQFNDFF